jgi:hypothetical protein
MNTPPPLRRKSGLRVLFIILVPFLLPLFIFVAWRVGISWKVHSKLKALKEAGYPTTLAEMEQMYYPPIPAELNNAVYLLSAFQGFDASNALSQIGPILSLAASPTNPALFSSTNLFRMHALVLKHQEILAILRQCPSNRQSCYPLDFPRGPAMGLPHLQPLKAGVGLVLVDAIYQSGEGSADGAVNDLLSANRLTQTLNDEPVIISQLVRMACWTYFNSALEAVLSHSVLSDNQLLDLSEATEREENPASVLHAFAAERCLGYYEIENFPAIATISNLASEESNGNNSGRSSSQVTAGYALFRAIGLVAANENYYLERMSNYVELCNVPFPQRLDLSDRLKNRYDDLNNPARLMFLANLFLVSGERFTAREGGDEARHNLRLTALAIERYRRANGEQLPPSLADLTPTFLPTVPVDPFDGKPLRYKKLDRGYRIYSIGPDRKDDGGVDRDPRKVNSPEDITFTVAR